MPIYTENIVTCAKYLIWIKRSGCWWQAWWCEERRETPLWGWLRSIIVESGLSLTEISSRGLGGPAFNIVYLMNWTQNITAATLSFLDFSYHNLGYAFSSFPGILSTTQPALVRTFNSGGFPLVLTKIMMSKYWVMNSNANNLQSMQSIAVKPSFIVSLYSSSKICNNFSSFLTALMMAL